MNRTEMSQLLALVALVDNRTVTDEATLEWHNLIGDLDYESALAAARAHYATSTAWLMPAHVRAGVRAARRAALPQTMSEPTPECGPGLHVFALSGYCVRCAARDDSEEA